MKYYKRLTDKYYPCVVCKNGKCLEQQYDCEEREVCEAWNRLFQLENKIESGEIDYVADRDKQIARLTAENAELRATLSKMETVEKELRERLEKAVELPRIIHPNTFEWHIQYQYKSGIIDSKIKFSIEAAEACPKELKEHNND